MSPVIHSDKDTKTRMAFLAKRAARFRRHASACAIYHDLDAIDLIREGGVAVEYDEGVPCGYFAGGDEIPILTEELRGALDSMQVSNGVVQLDAGTLARCEIELSEAVIEGEREAFMEIAKKGRP